MPPNKKGGKNYKKGKHDNDDPTLYERLDGQMYGRVLKQLGNCNVLVYCNDNRERICHIRGNMRKKVWISPGDIVLISLREMEKASDTIERGDICARYEQSIIYRLRQKDPSINEKLFTIVEKSDTIKNNNMIPDNEDGFVFESTNNEDIDTDTESESESESNSNTNTLLKPTNRIAQKRQMIDDDIDIDEI
jgi:translation initiation factor 1A